MIIDKLNKFIMVDVLTKIHESMLDAYASIVLPNQAAKDRLLADAQFMHTKFATLETVDNRTLTLVHLVADKALPKISTVL